jgi:hypothetical protein
MAALFAEGVKWKIKKSTIHRPFNATAGLVLPEMTADPM